MPALRVQIPQVLNVVGNVFSTLFVSINILVLGFFNTAEMPNGRTIVRSMQFLEVGSAEYNEALPVAFLMFAFYVVAFFAYVARAIFIAPSRVARDEGFALQYHFVWASYHPQRYYWGLATMVTSTLLALVSVLTSGYYTQLYLICIIAVVQLSMNQSVAPYNYDWSNRADTVCNTVFVLLAIVATSYVDVADVSEKSDGRVNASRRYPK